MLIFLGWISGVVAFLLGCIYFVSYAFHIKMNKEDELPMGAHLTYAEFIKFLDDHSKELYYDRDFNSVFTRRGRSLEDRDRFVYVHAGRIRLNGENRIFRAFPDYLMYLYWEFVWLKKNGKTYFGLE